MTTLKLEPWSTDSKSLALYSRACSYLAAVETEPHKVSQSRDFRLILSGMRMSKDIPKRRRYTTIKIRVFEVKTKLEFLSSYLLAI